MTDQEKKELLDELPFTETDLNRQLCYDAHRGTSFVPDTRADQEIAGYMDEMKEVSEQFGKFASPENEARLKADLEQYRQDIYDASTPVFPP
jgi:hypothetical protein